MTEVVQDVLNRLKEKERTLMDLIKAMGSGQQCRPIDIYSMAIVNRSLALINGFDLMLGSNNYHGAAHLVRLHLDSLLRYAALWISSDPNDFVHSVMSGVRVNSIKDKNGIKMTDAHLRDVVAKDYPWVKNVYDQTSGFIHFSKKHIAFSTMITDAQSGEVQHAIGREDRFVTDESRIEAAEAMMAISDCIADHLGWWILSKNGQPIPED